MADSVTPQHIARRTAAAVDAAALGSSPARRTGPKRAITAAVHSPAFRRSSGCALGGIL
ncbi:hypothetical protein [Streptomyces sp. NPDC047525]|uniref:hypothetical protein n=1 Tax=Streptomyces sp. NPDC047525 TaxID=3155264 RepID=UPI0033F9EC4D